MVTRKDREQVRLRAKDRCEYCGCPADHSPDDFAVEHIVPRSVGGTDALDNLAWSCQGCNARKFTAIEKVDAATGEMAALFHPRNDLWAEHFVWSEDTLEMIGITPTGRVTVERLQLNRRGVVNLRRLLVNDGKHPFSMLTESS